MSIGFKFSLPLFFLMGLVMFTASPALAQELPPTATGGNFDLLPAALTLLLPLGLILLTGSAMPEEQAPATASRLLLSWGAAALAYFAVGFAFQFGGIAQVTPDPDLRGLYWEWYPLDPSVAVDVARQWGVIAWQGWALSGAAATPAAFRLFLSHVSLVGVAALIPAASLPDRWRSVTNPLVAVLTGALIYPVAGNWLWGGGWLASLGASLGLGHGLVDFGGSSVIFLSASMATLAAALLFRSIPARDAPSESAEVVITTGLENGLTVYDEPPATTGEILAAPPMPSAYLPLLSLLGGGLMLLGWLGLAGGLHAPTALNFSPAQAAVNGLLAALSAALAAGAYSWFTTRALNPLMTSRGLAAGLVTAMAGAPFIPAWPMVLAGLLVGLLLPALIYLFDQKLRLADELAVTATYGISALVSLLLVAFLADGRVGQGWNGIGLTDYLGVTGQGVSGLAVASSLVADWPGQLQAQLLGLSAVAAWALVVSLLLFQTVKVAAANWSRAGLELTGSALAKAAHPAAPPSPEVEQTKDEDEG
ncbi:MAG: hypothetical protein AB1801_21330 [Chloroflexota bacterium]